MTSEYQAFRKKIVDELTREDPHMRYRDKMVVVTREWKEFKESKIVHPLTKEEMVSLPLNPTVRRRLKKTTFEEIPEVLCLIGKLVQEKEHSGIMNNFKNLFKSPTFYNLAFNGMDIWDILIVNNGGLVMKDIMETHFRARRLKDLVVRLVEEGRLGSFLNILVGVIYEKPNFKIDILTLLVRMIYNGVSPNTEFQCGEYKLSLPEDPLAEVRYAGTTLLEKKYSEKFPLSRGSVRFVGDTVFGFLLQNICNLKLKNFILTLLETGLVNLSCIIQPHSLSTDVHMDYLGAALKFAPTMFRNQVSCAIYKYTPKAVLLRPGNVDMFREVVSDILKTNWRGMTFFNACPRNIIHMLLEDGILDPSGDIYHGRLLLTLHGRRSLQTSFEIFQKNQTIRRVLNPDITHITQVIRKAGFRDLPVYHNDAYFSTCEAVGMDSPYIFISDDGYIFCRNELEYLLETRLNPFNRREFSENEIARMQTMRDMFGTYWYLFDLTSGKYSWLSSPAAEVSDMDFVAFIDGMLDRSDMFSYGCRVMDIVDRLKNNTLTILGFTGLVMGLGTIMTINPHEIMFEQCTSFARGKEDPYDIEEINTYYGIIFNHMSEEADLRRSFLQWVFLVLETTSRFSPSHALTSRLLSLTLFIQMIKNMK
jgi:hypothetical protein